MPNPFAQAQFYEHLVARLRTTDDFKEYEDAFQEATGLPLTLEPASQLTLALCSKHQARTTFCTLMNQAGNSCQTCQLLHRSIEREMGISEADSAERDAASGTVYTEKNPDSVNAVSDAFGDSPRTFECFAGLCETMVPVKADTKLVAFLKTGQVMVKKPTRSAFRQAMSQLDQSNPPATLEALEKAYFSTPIVPPERYRAMTTLLKTYAKQLSNASERIITECEHSEPDFIKRAKAYLLGNYMNPVTLADTANAANMSVFHFSKKFKEAVGIGFADYLSRLRIQEAKKLLWNPHCSITEAAYEVGFQSMASFNRSWRKLETLSPKQYRDSLTNNSSN